MQESSQSQENTVQKLALTGIATTSPSSTVAAESKQKGQSELVMRKSSSPLAAITNSGGQDYQLHTARHFPTESRPWPGGDGGSELVTGVSILLQASTVNRRPQILPETNLLVSGVMLCGHFEVEVYRI